MSATLNPAYLDIPTFQYLALGSNILGLFAASVTLQSQAAQGATSLSVTSNQGFLPSQIIWILDGPSSEMVQLTSSPLTGTTGLNLATPLGFTHSPGVNVSNQGSRGCLAQILLSASAWIETFCQQGIPGDRSFYQKSRTETVKMPTTRAHLDPDYTLVWRPKWLPVQTITSMSFAFTAGVSTPIDQTQAMFTDNPRLIYVPNVAPSGGVSQQKGWQLQQPPLLRGDGVFLQVTFTAGFAPGALPLDFIQAAVWVAQELLAYANNPTGAAQITQGSMTVVQRLRASGNKESSNDSIFLAQAKAALQQYRQMFV